MPTIDHFERLNGAHNLGLRLSVFLPNFNHGRFLPTAIDALLAQSVQPRTIWLLDDGSTDGSRDIIERYAAQNSHIRAIYREKNRGVISNLNEWLSTSEDEFVFFTAADDRIMPGIFEKSLKLFGDYPQAGLCSGLSRLMGSDGRDLGRFISPLVLSKPGYIAPNQAAGLLISNDSWFMGNTTIYRRLALQQAGGFDPELGGFSDGYTSRVIALKHGACFIPEDLAYWRRMTTGLAANSFSRPKIARSIADRAVALMTGRDAAIFPKHYAFRWRRRWLFGAASTMIADRNISERRIILYSILGPRSAIGKLVFIIAAFPAPIINLILFALMRPWDILRTARHRAALAFGNTRKD